MASERSSQRLGLVVALFALTGCRAITDADRYAVTEKVSCGPFHIASDARCEPLGVAECAIGFDSDGRGGCDPILTNERCGDCAPRATLNNRGCGGLEHPCACRPQSCPGEGSCAAERYPHAVGPNEQVRHVARDGADRSGLTGDGSRDRPFASLEAALASIRDIETEVTLLLEAGEFTAGVTVDRPRRLLGVCGEQTTLKSASTAPVVSIVGPAARGSSVQGVGVSGNGDGIAVSGAQDVRIKGVWVQGVGGHGITFDDQAAPASGTIEGSVVDGAMDIGVSVYGAAVTIKTSAVTATRPMKTGGRALGMLVMPSRYVERAADISKRTPGALCVLTSVVERCQGAGIVAEESKLDVRESVVRDILPATVEGARGIVMRAQPSGPSDVRNDTPTECSRLAVELDRGLELHQSVVERAGDIGVSLWNASALVSDSVIRDVPGTSAGRCLGNGVRARRDLSPDPRFDPRIELRRSVVERIGQSAVHVEGQRFDMNATILRDVGRTPCKERAPEALTLLASAAAPSRATVRRSWVAGAPGAAFAVTGSELTIDSSVLECNGAAFAGDAISAERVSCECGGRQVACGGVRRSVAPALRGGNGCDPDDGAACFKARLGAMNNLGSVLAQANVFSFDHPEVAAVESAPDGSVELDGLPLGVPTVAAAMQRDTFWGLSMVAPLERDAASATRVLLPKLSDGDLGGRLNVVFDARSSLAVAVRVCDGTAEPTVGREVCNGLPGVTGHIPGSKPPVYTDGGDYISVTGRATQGPHIIFPNVAPGEHVVTLTPPAGHELDCEVAPGNIGWRTENPNAFRIFAQETYLVLGAELVCSLRVR